MQRILLVTGLALAVLALLPLSPAFADGDDFGPLQIGSDANSGNNPFVQPGDCLVQDDGSLDCADPALAGGGRDQSLQFGDVLRGTRDSDVQVGGLGSDVLLGGRGHDVQLGGIEHFNPQNRDRAFGERGSDVFVWKPGDGSDFFDGGRGNDAIVFGVTAEDEGGEPVFEVVFDRQAGVVFIDPETGLPVVDVSGSPGFCEVVDASSGPEAAEELAALGLDHVVRFFIRGRAESFESGAQEVDNGLRVSLHLVDVEFLVCTSRAGGEIVVLDLTESPPRPIDLDEVGPRRLREHLEQMVE